MSVQGKNSPLHYHKAIGKIMWDKVGISRTEAGLKQAIIEIKALREDFWKNIVVLDDANGINKNLEHALRVADYLEFGELMAIDALHRKESCGGHFREESQTEDGEAKRDDENFSYVAAWEYKGEGIDPELHKEPLNFENIHLAQRSYK